MSKTKPTLYLFPNLLGDQRFHEPWLPSSIDKAVAKIDGLIAESPTGGRSFLKRFQTKKAPYDVPIADLNKNTQPEDIDFLLEPIWKGESWGLISDCGLPCIADPGARLVYRARQTGVNVHAFVGPSSITLSLMMSGLPGQRFSFLGYLGKSPAERKTAIIEMEMKSKKEDATQIFIEAPYRCGAVLKDLVDTLHDDTILCAAWDLTMQSQGILSQTVRQWKKSPLPNVAKKPTIFLCFSGKM
ncbi:MAG: 16S rRNA (cytidine1402-2'-O)-methyltransferase [Chlamydiales bacterium]|jgi:16S rRNA (cytidine1402-2'-O)-methyltransferase